MNYWRTYKKDIILNYLDSIIKQKIPLTLWQQHPSTRITFDAQFVIMNSNNIKLKLQGPNHIHSFDNERPIYIHAPGAGVIFKKDLYQKHANILEFTIPNDIQIVEQRKTKRFYYKYQDHKNITYYNDHPPLSDTKPKTLSSVLVDISTMGAGMVVGKDQRDKLSTAQGLFLENLTDQTLPTPFHVKVQYIANYNLKEKNLYKVGLSFDDELDSISYKSISSIIEIKQKKCAGLSQHTYCGLDEEEIAKILNQIEQTNRVLAVNLKENIDYLDKLRYMTSHMKVGFLKNVNQDLLAVALRLSGKELIYELFSELTETIQEEILFKLEKQRPPSAICKAQDEMIAYIREMEKKGEILLDPKAFITYV